MQLEDCFDFENTETKHGMAEEIRLKGTRLDIDIIVRDFNEGKTPIAIQASYPTADLEQMFAAITYYLRNRASIDAYIERGQRIKDAYYQEYLEKGPYFLRDEALALKAAEQARE